jgi:hypothetical protein
MLKPDTFEADFRAMTESLKARNLAEPALRLLLPSYSFEKGRHDAARDASTTCGCRVCYWAKSK